MYEGEIKLNFLFDAENASRIDTKELVLPFTTNIDCRGAMPNSEIETNIGVTLQDFTVMPDENIDIKIDLEFSINISNNQTINVIEEIDIDETREQERYSLIIYFVKPGDTLWNIAKRFRSTVSNIATINNLEDENKINIGEQLFIPIAT